MRMMESARRMGALLCYGAQKIAPPVEPVCFRCNICQTPRYVSRSALGRVNATCLVCGSSVLTRAVACIASRCLLGKKIPLAQAPRRLDIKVIGISDEPNYAARFACIFDYSNTYYHKDLHLDLANPPEKWRDTADMVIAVEIFEHVAPPVSRAFEGAFSLLKPGGTLLLSVPYTLEGQTSEHFRDLNDYRLVEEKGHTVLLNTTVEGHTQRFEDIVLHKGNGLVLEMRVFTLKSLIHDLEQAGFVDVMVEDEEYLPFGIIWRDRWSIPLTARKPSV